MIIFKTKPIIPFHNVAYKKSAQTVLQLHSSQTINNELFKLNLLLKYIVLNTFIQLTRKRLYQAS